MFFLLFLLDDKRIRMRIRIREAQKHMDPTDRYSDPQNCPDGKIGLRATCATERKHTPARKKIQKRPLYFT
jgi:hypothetical protein